MTHIITITDYTRLPSLTDGDKLSLEAEAMRNTQRRIEARKATLQAHIDEELYTPTGLARSYAMGLLMALCFGGATSCFVAALMMWLAP